MQTLTQKDERQNGWKKMPAYLRDQIKVCAGLKKKSPGQTSFCIPNVHKHMTIEPSLYSHWEWWQNSKKIWPLACWIQQLKEKNIYIQPEIIFTIKGILMTNLSTIQACTITTEWHKITTNISQTEKHNIVNPKAK